MIRTGRRERRESSASSGCAQPGLSLVEILIALALMGTVGLSVSMIFLKMCATSDSYKKFAHADIELDSLASGIRKDLDNATWIDPSSHSRKLVFTTLDESGNPVQRGYRIIASGGKDILEYSLDGVTWGISPYSISDASAYSIDSGEFLFCGYENNCTRFTDDGTIDGNWSPGEGRAQVSGTQLLDNPSYARKVVFSQFSFNRQQGMPLVKRTWPDLYGKVARQHVSVVTRPLQAFDVNPATNADFDNGFSARDIFYDWRRDRLILAGADSGADNDNFIYRLNTDGVREDNQNADSIGNVDIENICLDADGDTALSFDGVSAFSRYNLASGTPGAATDTFTINLNDPAYFDASGVTEAVACDPAAKATFYLKGRAGDGTASVKKVTRSGGVTTLESTFPLPTAMNGQETAGFTIDPFTGDFYFLQAAITGSDPSKTMTVYHVRQAAPTIADTFAINISTLGSTATGTATAWGLAYDAFSNHLFILDGQTAKVYDVIPPRLLSPKV